MIKNIDLFDKCLNNEEPLINTYYCTDSLIISNANTDTSTPIMSINRNIIKRITAIQVSIEDNEDIDNHIDKLINQILIHGPQ